MTQASRRRGIAGAGVNVGRVGGALLVAGEDVVDGGEFAQGVVDGEDRAGRVAEDGGRAFVGEGGPEDFGAGEGGVGVAIHALLHSVDS